MGNRSVICYPTLGKAKAYLICEIFARGCGGLVAAPVKVLDGDAFFYGVAPSTLEIFKQVRTDLKRNWFYCDNSYFDCVRQKQFRITKNAMQICDPGYPDYNRLKNLGIKVEPWRKSGRNVMIVESSPWHMELVGHTTWTKDVIRCLRGYTERPIVVRKWERDKAKASSTFIDALKDTWAVVTHSSAAAITAALAGVPVFVPCAHAAFPVSSGMLAHIENPRYNHIVSREEWAAGLASNQWTLEEISNGTAWGVLNG